MRNLLAVTVFSGLSACGPNERVDAFELGSSCDVGQLISDCEGFAAVPDAPGEYVQRVEQPAVVLGVPVKDVRLRVVDGLVSRVYAEFDLDLCPAVDARLKSDLGAPNRNEITLAHWRGTAFAVDLDYPIDRPVCTVVVEERSMTRPFGK